MLVKMKRQLFESMDYATLGWACIEPTVQQIHSEKGYQMRFQIYEQLTTGQRALFMFRVLYGHASKGVVEFFRVAQFYCDVVPSDEQWDAWSGVKMGLIYFGDDAMLRLLEEMENVYQVLTARNRPGDAEWHSVSIEGLDGDSEPLATIARLDEVFLETASATFKRIGKYIRRNPNEFVQLEN